MSHFRHCSTLWFLIGSWAAQLLHYSFWDAFWSSIWKHWCWYEQDFSTVFYALPVSQREMDKNQGTSCSTISKSTVITWKTLRFRAINEDTSVGQSCSHKKDSNTCCEHEKGDLTQPERASFFLLLWKNCFAT